MKKNYSVSIKNLIALCHIIDDLESFERNLKFTMTDPYASDFANQLLKLSQGMSFAGGRIAKNFYNKNKNIIDTLSKYTYIYDFIYLDYWRGDLQYFCGYILNNKNNIDKIITMLEKINDLGFVYLEFNSELDFTQEVYEFDKHPEIPKNIAYLDNLEAIPTYNTSVLKYKTCNSNYKIVVENFFGRISSKKIILNDLNFDSNRLPNAITKEEIFDRIIALKNQKKQEYSQISDSVNLSVGIHDLYEIFNKISSKINNTENIERKEELIELLHNIKDAISKMQSISDEYNKQISSTSDDISEELLSSEKDAYIRARRISSIDFC